MSSSEGTALIPVRVELTVVSSVEGRAGVETMTARMAFPAVPRVGELVELAPGWSAVPVGTVIYSDGREPLVRLRQAKTDDPDRLDEFGQMIRAHGWKAPHWPW